MVGGGVKTVIAGKNIVITGAAGGIGRALVESFLNEGAHVWATDVHAEGLTPITEKNLDINARLHIQKLDVSKSEDYQQILRGFSERGKTVDVWINNAGINLNQRFEAMELEDFFKIMNINFEAIVRSCHFVLPFMERQSCGTIVNVASVAGHVAAPYMSAYCSSKHAVVGFTRALQAELDLSQSPVGTMLVCPGFVETDLIAKGQHLGFPEWLQFALAKPQKVARAIVTGLKRNEREIYPTINGKLMLTMHRFFPQATRRNSKVLLAQSFKDYLMNRYRV